MRGEVPTGGGGGGVEVGRVDISEGKREGWWGEAGKRGLKRS